MLVTTRAFTHAARVFHKRVVVPLHDLLLMGIGPHRLAWSLAVGFVIGVNPLLGSTTLFCLVIALVFRLNLIASQIANHIVYPLELLLFGVFLRAGDYFFHTGRLPLRREALFSAVRHHPLATTRLLWYWEWHALILWLLFAIVVMPLLAAILAPMLRKLLITLHQPIVED